MDEYNRTGKLTNFFSEVLEHYKRLPAIEQAQYPKDYAADLQSKIDLDFNYLTHRAEGKDKDPMRLIATLFKPSTQQTNELRHKNDATDSFATKHAPKPESSGTE